MRAPSIDSACYSCPAARGLAPMTVVRAAAVEPAVPAVAAVMARVVMAAKRFVDMLLTSAEGVTICTTKPDKYDRYLADVFLQVAGAATGSTGSLQAGTGQAEEIFLNNALLQNGHAVRKGAYAPADWEG